MREHKRENRGSTRLNFIHSRTRRNRLSNGNRKGGFRVIGYIHRYDWSTGINEFDFSYAWYSYRLSAIYVSAATFGVGLSQLVIKLKGG